MKGKTDPSLFLLVIIAALLTAGVLAALYTMRTDPIEEALSGDRVINVLYVIEKDKKPLSTFVLMYYPATKRAVVFDIPGDLGLLIKRINRVDRIDTVYHPGRINGFQNEIENLLGINITFFMVAAVENLTKVVDLIEGVELFIPSPVELRGDGLNTFFPSGLSRLDGDKAALYITYEIPEEDREMPVFRRRRFFLGLLKRQSEMNETLKNPAVSRMYQNFFVTDLDPRTRIRLFDELVNIDTDRTSIQSVEGSLRGVSGQTLLIPNYDGDTIKDIVLQALGRLTRQSEGPLSERVFTVEVLNGTPTNGLAGRTAGLVRSFGYDVISVANAVNSNYEKTEIVYRADYEEAAHIFADTIRCQTIRAQAPPAENPEREFAAQDYKYRSDFTLIIGRDFNGRYVTGN